MTRRVPFLLLAVIVVATPAMAHDLYLVTGVRGAEDRICARIGEHFPESFNALSADRVDAFRLHDNEGIKELFGKQESTQFCAFNRFKPPAIAEIVVRRRPIKLQAKDFNNYIHGEGLRDVIRLREERGQTDAEGKEVYSRFGKLLIGSAGEKATRPLGHELEIVPEQDPSGLHPYDDLPIQVLFRGKPLADVQVAAVYSGAELKGHEYPVTTRTDSQGRAKLRLDRPGLWYARLIYMIPAENEPDVDWRSFFATLTFETGKGPEATSDGRGWTIARVESRLRDAGIEVRRGSSIRQPFMSVPGTVLIIRDSGEAEIQTYIYSGAESRTRDTDRLDKKRVAPPTMMVSWLMQPSLIADANLALIVLTNDESLRQRIAQIFATAQ